MHLTSIHIQDLLTITSIHDDIDMKNVFSGGISANTNFGDIAFQNIDANTLCFTTSHGDIEGQLQGYQEEYQTTYEISHGACNLEKNTRQ